MQTIVERKSESVLFIHEKAEQSLNIILVIVSSVIVVVGLIAKSAEALYFLAGTIIGIIGLLTTRDISCTFDKSTGILLYKLGGLLRSGTDAVEEEHPLSGIQAIQMKRHIGRGRDRFQVRLDFGSEGHLNLSSNNLGFGECQSLANQIQQFLGADVPVKAVD